MCAPRRCNDGDLDWRARNATHPAGTASHICPEKPLMAVLQQKLADSQTGAPLLEPTDGADRRAGLFFTVVVPALPMPGVVPVSDRRRFVATSANAGNIATTPVWLKRSAWAAGRHKSHRGPTAIDFVK